MDDMMMENAILAQLRFGILGITEDLKTIEQMANATALKIKEDFAKIQLNANGINTSALTAQQAMVEQIQKQGQARNAVIVAEGEAKISSIQTKEALARQQIAQKEAQTQLAIKRSQLAEEQILYMQSRRNAFENQPQGMGGLLIRHASWFATGAVLFEGFGLLKDAVVDVEKGMKGLQTVLPQIHESEEAFNEASQEAIDLMQKFGAELDEVMTSARSFGRMYKDTETVMGLTHNAILLNVIDMVRLEDAVKGNEAALSIYGKELQNTNEVLAFSGKLMDSLTRLSHESMAQASDLIQILQQSAGAAKNAKVSMDQLLGTGASAVRATGLQGQGGNLGRMLRTVFTQLSAPTQAVERDIEEIGVKMRDANGELRSAYDIILDLALATQDATISQEELNQAINRAASGKFQYSKLAALVGSFDEIVVNTARSINSQGQTMVMAAQQLDTIERKAKMLRNTFIDLFSGVGDSGLREGLKDLIDGLNQFIMGLNKTDASVYEFGFKLLGAVVVIKTLTAVYNALLPVTAMATLLTNGLTVAQARQAIATHGAAGALAMERTALIASTVATEAATGATNAFNAALIRNPIGLVITLLTVFAGVALTKYISKMGEAEKATLDLNQAQEETFQFAQQHAMQMNTTIDYLETLKEKHHQLTEAINSGKLSTEELREAKKSLNAVEEAVLILADGETRAKIKLNGVTEEEIQLVLDSAIKEKEADISRMESQKSLTDTTIAETYKRIEALEQENNLYVQMSKNIPKTLGIKPGKPSKGSFTNLEPGIKKTALKLEDQELNKQIAKSTELAHSIIVAKGELDKLKHAAPGDGSGGSGSGSAGSSVDAISESLKQLADSSNMFELANYAIESSLEGLNRNLNTAGAEYDYLNSKVEAGSATSTDFARMQELIGIKMGLVKREQDELTSANALYQQQINALNPILATATAEYERFKAAGDAEHMKDAASAVKDLQSEIDSLSGAIASNTAKVWENKGALEQLAITAYSGYYQSMMSWMQHMEAIGRLNTQQQLDYLKGIDETMLKQGEGWKLEEDRFKERRALLDEEMARIKSAYDERMRQYENEIEANDKLIESKEKQAEAAVNAVDDEIKAIQRLMDLLDDDAESEDREEAERQHNKKLAELAEERLYHEHRTGLDHQDRIKEINDEIAEENQRWRLQQNDWARKDQKDAYQDQIDALKDRQKAIEKSAREEINQLKTQNDRKKQEMQNYYRQIEQLLNDHTLDVLAALGSANEDMYQKGLDWMRNLAQGIRDGKTEASAEMQDFFGNQVPTQYGGLPSGSNAGMPSSPPSASNGGVTREQANARAERARAQLRGLGYSQGVSDISSYTTVEGTEAWYNTYIKDRKDLPANIKALFYEIVEARKQWVSAPQAHIGAYVEEGGFARLRHDERVLSPKLTASFDRLASVLVKTPDITSRISGGDNTRLEQKLDRLIAVTEQKRLNVDKAINIESVSFEDRADMQALGIEIRSMLTANG